VSRWVECKLSLNRRALIDAAEVNGIWEFLPASGGYGVATKSGGTYEVEHPSFEEFVAIVKALSAPTL
jgi:hypothetical protein